MYYIYSQRVARSSFYIHVLIRGESLEQRVLMVALRFDLIGSDLKEVIKFVSGFSLYILYIYIPVQAPHINCLDQLGLCIIIIIIIIAIILYCDKKRFRFRFQFRFRLVIIMTACGRYFHHLLKHYKQVFTPVFAELWPSQSTILTSTLTLALASLSAAASTSSS